MANTLTAIMPKILARGLLALRETCVMPQLVNGSYSAVAAAFGSTIDVPLPTAQAASDVTPSNTPPAAGNTTPPTVQILLNNWKKTNFFLSDKDMQEIDKNQSFMPMQISEAIRSLANAVNLTILQEYKGIYGYAGTAATTPFVSTVVGATDLRKRLHIQLCPRSDRRFVMNYDAEANALALAAFSNFEQTGDPEVKREGSLGRKFGFDWYTDDQILTHTSTVFTAGAVTVNGVQAINAGSTDGGRNGTVSIAKATNTSPLVKGDIITIATDPQQGYVVTADTTLAVGNTSVPIAPALQKATAGGEAVTLIATHVVNMGFHRDAFAFANRPLANSSQDMALGSQIVSMTDPLTGISLRLEVSRQYKQVNWEFDLLWGSKLVRAALAARLLG